MDEERINTLLAQLMLGDSGLPNGSFAQGTRASQETVNANVGKVELTKGPAEQTAYYDFTVLNIAFGHIWKQLIDPTPGQVQGRLKQEMEKRGGPLDVNSPFSKMFLQVKSMLDTIEVPAKVAAEFDISREEWDALTFSQRLRLESIAVDIGYAHRGLSYDPDGKAEIVVNWGFPPTVETIQRPAGYYSIEVEHADRLKSDLRAQGESLLDHVRATNTRSLHRLLRELDDSLQAKHSFTAFGTDSTARAVNFGILNTYRQRWDPLNYQVGDLVKTVPLAPKEERKYTIKRTVKEKKIEKEVRKYNSTISHTKQGVSRDEEDIANKAQKQIKFDLEGSYNGASWSVKSSLGIDVFAPTLF
jgi:hypothetical protein